MMTDTNQLNWQRTNLENVETAWEGDLWDRKRLGVQLTNYVGRLQLILNHDLNIENTFIDQLLNAYNVARNSNDSEYQLSVFLRNVSICDFDHSNNFIKNWENYIKRGL
ncbi:hypothetical protein [Acinetobacter sp. UBA6720]|uniref:hypothetical protein n=1 Tax=Acinetobacter sp. UBA6720 TaxID=1945953 RepID=UPI0025BF16DB|nr:hypothetical protein [Acinetobacter sp. UBA6720]